MTARDRSPSPCIVVCDHVHVDPITGKYVLLGTIAEIEAPEFPFVLPQMAVYVARSRMAEADCQ